MCLHQSCHPHSHSVHNVPWVQESGGLTRRRGSQNKYNVFVCVYQWVKSSKKPAELASNAVEGNDIWETETTKDPYHTFCYLCCFSLGQSYCHSQLHTLRMVTWKGKDRATHASVSFQHFLIHQWGKSRVCWWDVCVPRNKNLWVTFVQCFMVLVKTKCVCVLGLPCTNCTIDDSMFELNSLIFALKTNVAQYTDEQ